MIPEDDKRVSPMGEPAPPFMVNYADLMTERQSTVLISRFESATELVRSLGAHHVLLSTDPEAMKQAMGRFDFILDTVSAQHDLDAVCRRGHVVEVRSFGIWLNSSTIRRPPGRSTRRNCARTLSTLGTW